MSGEILERVEVLTAQVQGVRWGESQFMSDRSIIHLSESPGCAKMVPTQAHADKCESLKAPTAMKSPRNEDVPVPAPRYHEYHGQIPEKVSPSGQTLIIAKSSLSASSVTVTVRVESQPEVPLEPQQRNMEHITSHIDLARASQPFPRQSSGRDWGSTKSVGKSGASAAILES